MYFYNVVNKLLGQLKSMMSFELCRNGLSFYSM